MMFGYVRYDLPHLYIKDFMLYKAIYCGLCRSIGKACGQTARLGLTYDVAFLSALLHNLTGTDVIIEQRNCFEHLIGKRPIAACDALTEELGALNTVLAYYKLADDVKDGEKRRGGVLFAKGFRRAKKKYPELVALTETYMREQAAAERLRAPSADAAAEPTAAMMTALSDHFMGEKATNATRGLFYALGKWVYLIDALDDVEKDAKKDNYNPFVKAYGVKTRAELLEKNGEEIGYLFDTLFASMREHLAGVSFRFNHDLTDNVILLGIPAETRRVMKGEKRTEMNIKR